MTVPFWMGTVPLQHVTACDVAGTLVAMAGFWTLLYAPGYIIARASGVFDFHRQHFAGCSVIAVACSFAVSPIAAFLLGPVGGVPGIALAAWIAAAAAIFLMWRDRSQLGASLRPARLPLAIGAAWTIFVLLMLVDWQHGQKLYFSVVMADQSYRIAFTDAVARGGVPPANPLYFGGAPAAMHYFYFWYVLCAAVMKIAHVTARQAFTASSIWAGFGLMATVNLYATRFFAWGKKLRWTALALLAVTGADLLPSVGNAVLQPHLNGDIEWWSVDPIDAWPDSLLWVPHHVASVLCCLLAFLLLWQLRSGAQRHPQATRKLQWWSTALAAAALASAFGLSVYVTCGFAMMAAAWLAWLAMRHRQELAGMARVYAVTAAGAALLLAPFVAELVRTTPRTPANPASTAAAQTAAAQAGPSAHLFNLSVRKMIDPDMLTGLPALGGLHRAHPLLLDQAVRLALLLPGLAMELGLYGVVLVFLLRRRRHRLADPDFARDTAFFFTISGLVITMFVSSSVISNNDFGYRAVMLPQFFLLLLTADVLHAAWTGQTRPFGAIGAGWRRWMRAMLWLGVAGTVFGALLLRLWLPWEERVPASGFEDSAADAFQVRDGFARLAQVAAPAAVIAFQPNDPVRDKDGAVMTPFEYFQRSVVMDVGHQMLNAEGKCALHFGGDAASCPAIQAATARLYGVPAPDAATAQQYCARFGVQYLLLSHRDAAWTSAAGVAAEDWTMTLPVVVTEPGLRILSCSAGR